jgi:hypothetical protein
MASPSAEVVSVNIGALLVPVSSGIVFTMIRLSCAATVLSSWP